MPAAAWPNCTSTGIIAGLVHEYPQQTLKKVIVGALATLDPVAASELIRDLELLRA
ncbi:hypothetical protein INH39_02330 [Massilia violaceinigra]|uniref:Uncharacterized protein n=1 Tax=Massilia violaceinigra TaxID=2045208 RepID=A0ABY4A875_9BURK|nr:hypothetical protein [Massilia violaceinigra]UOD30607.1 hypothetical protein INH39_02330 [Massilia violaceinigra]